QMAVSVLTSLVCVDQNGEDADQAHQSDLGLGLEAQPDDDDRDYRNQRCGVEDVDVRIDGMFDDGPTAHENAQRDPQDDGQDQPQREYDDAALQIKLKLSRDDEL